MMKTDINTPTYVYDEDAFFTNVSDVITFIRRHYPKFKLAYSYKTNYFMPFLEMAKKLSLYAEIVSPQEFALTESVNIKYHDIIYNGVIDDFSRKIAVADAGGIVNIENMPEMIKFIKYTNDNRHFLEIGIRVNFDLGNGLTSRFGIDVNGSNFDWLCNPANHPYISFKCVHFQFGGSAGGLRTPEMFRKRVRNCVEIARKLGANIIDIGGNIIGRMSADYRNQFPYKVPTMEEVCNAIGQEMALICPEQDIELIAECGSALVTNAMHLLTTITNINVVRGKTFLTCDCRKQDAGWSVNRYNPSHIYIGDPTPIVHDAIVCGCECREEDVIIRKYIGQAEVGGRLLLCNIGAYSYSIVNDFITQGCRRCVPIENIKELKHTILICK